MKTSIILLSVMFIFQNSSENISFPEKPGWKVSTDFPVYSPANLWDYINGAADGYLSFGFQELRMAEYTRGKQTIKVEVYRHKDDLHAFGIYATERSPRYEFLDIGAQGYQKGEILNFLAGENYVKLQANTDKSKAVKTMISIAESLATNLDTDANFPKLLKTFPEKGKVANRESFIAQNFLGHEFLNEVFTTDYEVKDKKFRLFLTEKSSPEECKMLIKKYLEFTGQDLSPVDQGLYLIKDRYNGDIPLIWDGNVIYGIYDCEDPKLIEEYLDEMGRLINRRI